MEKVGTLAQPTPSTWVANSELEHNIPFFGLVTFSEAVLGIVSRRGLEDGLEEFGGKFQGEGGKELLISCQIFWLLTYTKRDVTRVTRVTTEAN